MPQRSPVDALLEEVTNFKRSRNVVPSFEDTSQLSTLLNSGSTIVSEDRIRAIVDEKLAALSSAQTKSILIQMRTNLPTSPVGLLSGDPWNNGGTIAFVP